MIFPFMAIILDIVPVPNVDFRGTEVAGIFQDGETA